jgi:hypothetical protein
MLILNSLDEEIAADALEEISPERQVTPFTEMDTKGPQISLKRCHPTMQLI